MEYIEKEIKSKWWQLNRIQYDNVTKDSLKNGTIEKVEGPGNPGKVIYLPHQAFIRTDHSSIKLCVVFDASAKSKS